VPKSATLSPVFEHPPPVAKKSKYLLLTALEDSQSQCKADLRASMVAYLAQMEEAERQCLAAKLVELFMADTSQQQLSHSVSFAPPEDEETQFVVAEKTSSFMALNDLINQPETAQKLERL